MGTAEDVLKHVPSIVKKKDGYEVVGKGNTMNVYLAKEQHVLDVSISKSFLKDALTLEIKGNDLLYKCWDADLLYNQKMELLQVSKRGTRETCNSPFAISSIPHVASTKELVSVMQS